MTAFGQMMLANSLANSRKPMAQVQRAKAGFKANKAKPASKSGTIAASIIAGLRSGKTPQKVLALVLKKHKGKTTIACVYWYKSRMNRGLIAAK